MKMQGGVGTMLNGTPERSPSFGETTTRYISGIDVLRVIGFAFDRTWMNAMFLATIPAVSSVENISEFTDSFYFSEIGACSIAMAAIFLISVIRSVAAFSYNAKFQVSRIVSFYAGGAIAFFSIAFVALYAFDLIDFTGCPYVFGLFAGLGEALLLVMWGRSFCHSQNKTGGLQLSASVFIGGLLGWIISLSNNPATLFVVSLFPLASAFLLHCVSSSEENGWEAKTFARIGDLFGFEDSSGFFFRYTIKLALVTLLLSLSLSSIRFIFGSASAIGGSQIIAPIAAGVMCLALFYWDSCFEYHELRYVYRIIIAVTFCGVSSLLLIENYNLSDFLGRTGLFSFEIFFFLTAINMSHQLKAHPILCVSIVEFGYLFGEFAGLLVFGKGEFMSSIAVTQSIGIGIILITIFLCYAFVFTEADIVNAESQGIYELEEDRPAPQSQESNTRKDSDAPTPSSDFSRTMVYVLEEGIAKIGKENSLTQREMDVLSLLAAGYSRKLIRETLYLSEGTVNTHITHIYQKLGIKKRDDILDMIIRSKPHN